MMLGLRGWGGIAVLTAVVCCSAACSSSGSSGSAASKQFQILAVLPLSGDLAQHGHEAEIAAQIAVAEVNSHGGFDGEQGVLTIKDDGDDPTRAVAVVTQAVSGGNIPDMVISGASSDEAVPVLPILAKAKVLQFSCSGASDYNVPAKYPLAFSTSPSPSDVANDLFAEMQQKGYKSVGMLTTDDVLGHSQATGYAPVAAKDGITFNTRYVPDNAVSATAQLQQLLSTKPDALIISAEGSPVVTMLQARATLGVTLPTYGDATTAGNDVYSLAGAQLSKGVLIQTYPDTVVGTPITSRDPFTTFYAGVKAHPPIVGSIVPYSFCGYDPIAITAGAANVAKSTQDSKIAAALNSGLTATQVPLALGPTAYNADNHQPDYTSEDFYWAPVSPLEDGLYTPTS
jgi:ABC-type branched-subunit amino acid transport system substrate-binding protein